MAGVSRLQYATPIRLVRVMCSGRVDMAFVLRAFAGDVDGVFIGACRLNECNYITHGNFNALNMVLLCKKMLKHIGVNPDRLRIEFMSSGEGMRFGEAVDDFVGQVKALGPLGENEATDSRQLKSKLSELRKLVPYIKMAKKKKLARHLEDPAQYDRLYSDEEIQGLFDDVPAYHIDPKRCQACMICRRRCPAEAIDGAKNRIHIIDQDRCIKCGTCLAVCPPRFGAVKVSVGEPVPAPIAEEARSIVRKRNKASSLSVS